MTLAIDVRDLVKRYGPRTVVDHVNLAVEQGRICGFLGPNGSGKTTTLRMICGLLTPDGGGGTCLGHDLVRDRDAIKRQAGYMTQRFGLYEDLTIRENLEFVARVYGLDRQKERVDQSLERLGLATRQKQLAGALSGGWKQRLALAACVLHEPKLLLLDEPTAGVDPKARRALGSTPAVGSSSSSSRGSCSTQAASASRCFQPPDSEPASWPWRVARPNRSSDWSTLCLRRSSP